MMPPHGAATQSFEMVDIGLDQNYIDSLQSPFSFILEEDIRPLLGRRDTFSHKGDYGHVLLVAGSDNMTGAAVLAAHAGLRSGCGKMTVASTAMVHSAIQSTLPECMVRSRDSISKVDVEKNTLVVGPGLGRGEKVKELLMDLFDKRSTPCVIDADALYSIGASLEMIKLVPKESILTPHPGEFKLLTGKEFSGRDGFDIGRSYAEEHSVYLLVKGAYTALFCPDGKVCFNSTGNPSMAKGGSGDVLTGMIGAFLAQDHSAKESALIAMFLHGAAGDLAARNESPISVLASDLIENIGSAFNQTAGLTPGEKD
jgi:NAD(P)H-hydrate epimerase